MQTPRYLVPFHPKRVPHYFTDVLIIGGGLAGVRAALGTDAGLSALMITKDTLQVSNSAWAQGGIAGVIAPSDRFEDHVADTLLAGGSLCDPEVVRRVICEAPRRIDELIAWGTRFDTAGSRLALGREGGHGHDRIVHALGDATGKEVMRAVTDRLRRLDGIEIWEQTFTIDLLTLDGACRGAIVWNQEHGKTLVWAKQTILATGGAGQLYRETTNPPVATGDGLALAYRAGAELRDMEFVQFHPTVLYIAGASRSLISEATRGEGAHLVDRHGHRFMPDYDPRAELAPRDVVSLAIVSQMEKTRYPNVYLDMTHLDRERVLVAFSGHRRDLRRVQSRHHPRSHSRAARRALHDGRRHRRRRRSHDAARPVGRRRSRLDRPARRESPGQQQPAGSPGLRRARGRRRSRTAQGRKDDFSALPIDNPRIDSAGEPLNLDDIRNALQSLMWRNVGVRRDAEGLAEARETVGQWCRYALARQLRRSRRLGIAKHALRGPLDDRRGARPRGKPRHARPHRFPRPGRGALEPAYLFPAGMRFVAGERASRA